MDQNLKISVEQREHITIVKLSGSADARSAGEMERCFTRLSAGRPKWVVFDMVDLSALTSLAMGQLVSLKRAMNHYGGALYLVTTPLIHASLKHTRLDTMFQCVGNLDDALAACSARK